MATTRNKHDKQHLENMKTYEKQVKRIYLAAIKQAVRISGTTGQINPLAPFSFDDHPAIKKRLDKLLDTLKRQLNITIITAIKKEWELANTKNDEMTNKVFSGEISTLNEQQKKQYFARNEEALEAFIQRKTNGLNLSDKIWHYTQNLKTELEFALEDGLKDGKPADVLSRSVRQYLKQPDKLFRRVRDKHGQLHLSKRAKEYHPGRGVYRSSYKNARRLAATETNIAYRTADHLRWQQMDFVVGMEIHLSNNHTLNGKPFKDICDELAGKYPKDFKFTGWHPLCRCFATAIIKTQEELDRDTRRILNGGEPATKSKNQINSLPENFNRWIAKNKNRIEKAKQLPYFLKDNQYYTAKAKYIAKRYVEYGKYKNNQNYYNTAFNWKTGAYIATHKEHKTDKVGGIYERQVQTTGLKNKHSVVLEQENHSLMNIKNVDGLWDGNKMEIAAATTGTANNIRNALKHCATKPTEIAIIVLPQNLLQNDLNKGLKKYFGLKGTKQYKDFKEIIFIQDEKIKRTIKGTPEQ